jgi:hypothetical protein
MSKNENLFKAATFLTTLMKSDNKDVYLHEGFTSEDMVRELKELTYKTGSKLFDYYEEKIDDSIEDVLSCLSHERLIYFKNNRYFVTADGESISHFMTSLSKMYFEESQAIMQYPYRFYPNSEQIYGLN